jgi:hypothetical protein
VGFEPKKFIHRCPPHASMIIAVAFSIRTNPILKNCTTFPASNATIGSQESLSSPSGLWRTQGMVCSAGSHHKGGLPFPGLTNPYLIQVLLIASDYSFFLGPPLLYFMEKGLNLGVGNRSSVLTRYLCQVSVPFLSHSSTIAGKPPKLIEPWSISPFWIGHCSSRRMNLSK